MRFVTQFKNHPDLMEKDFGNIISKFRDLSSKMSEMIYDDFKRKVKKLDRQKDENVFQLLQARYINELDKQLQQAAEKMVQENNKYSNLKLLRNELANQSSYILSEFLQKARSM
jgi:hypothetical protein